MLRSRGAVTLSVAIVLVFVGGVAWGQRIRPQTVAVAEAALDQAERGALPAAIVGAARAHADACVRAWGAAAIQSARCRQRLGEALVSNEDSAEAKAVLTDVIVKLTAAGPAEAERGARARSSLGRALLQMAQYAEAETALTAALALQAPRLGDAHVDTFRTLARLASLRVSQMRLTDAETLLTRAEMAAAHAPVPPGDDAYRLAVRGRLADRLDKREDAERWLRQSLARMDEVYQPDDPRRGFAMSTLAIVLERMNGRLDDAEAVARRDLEINERVYGPLDPRLGTSLNNLANILHKADRTEEAEVLYRRAAVSVEAEGGDLSRLAIRLHNLALALAELGRLQEAETVIRRALDVYSQSSHQNPVDRSRHVLVLASVRAGAGDLPGAEGLTRQATEDRRSALGEDHGLTTESLLQLGLFQLRGGRAEQAEATLRVAIPHAANVHGPEGYRTSLMRSLLGGALSAQGRTEEAWEEALAAMRGFSRISRAEIARTSSSGLYDGLDQTLEVARKRAPRNDAERQAVFNAMQLASRSFTGAAAVRTAARLAQADPEFAALDGRVRALMVRVTQLERRDTEARGRGDASQIREASAALAADREALLAAERELSKRHPLFADVAGKLSIRLADINGPEGVLRRGEAMLLAVQMDAQLDLMLVTTEHARFASIDLTEEQAAALAGRIRASLRLEGALSPSELSEFDLAAAHELYRRVIGPFRSDLARVETLYVIPDGPIASVPFSLLAADPSSRFDAPFERYRRTRYLADEVALATLPSPAAFVAARRHARATRERDTLLAFADPALAGTEDVRTLTQWTNLRNGIRAPTAGARNAASVCRLRPLPETRREALALAERLGSRPGDVLLGRAASERALSELDASGALARRRIVLFATHGLVAGELSGVGEPALVLTPPEGCAATSEEDDGLLTASEIAMLTFDADWVILSGCNTAAPGRTGAAPLSGLARAFLYAGARRLLVSHWSVDSEAAADLTAALFDPRNKDLTPAAALQRAMRSVRDSRGANDYRAHPAFWAPFVLVGDGR